jgi:hypothetical protein
VLDGERGIEEVVRRSSESLTMGRFPREATRSYRGELGVSRRYIQWTEGYIGVGEGGGAIRESMRSEWENGL